MQSCLQVVLLNTNKNQILCHVQRFLLLQFLLRWLAIGVWVLFAVLAYHVSFYVQHEQLNLHLATGISAGFLAVVCTAVARLLYGVMKAFKNQQSWYAAQLNSHSHCLVQHNSN